MSETHRASTSQERRRREKREQFTQTAGRRRRLAPGLAFVGLALVAALTFYLLRASGDASAPQTATTVQSDGGAIRIPLAELNDGRAKFFEHVAADNRRVRFFALRGPDETYRAALDACEVCYYARKGYFQRGDQMVCTHCGQSFPTGMINKASGGCHPIGLPRAVDGDHLVIATSDLEAIDAEHAAKATRSRRPMSPRM